MGSFRFRRSTRIPPGAEFSAGVEGARASVNPDERRTKSIRIVGAGLNDEEEKGPGKGRRGRRGQGSEVARPAHFPELEESFRARAELLSSLSVEATDVNGEVLWVNLHFDAATIAGFQEAAEQKIESEGGSTQDRWLADDPQLADWTVAEVAQATVRQLGEATKEIEQRAVYRQLVENPELLEQLREQETDRVARALSTLVADTP